ARLARGGREFAALYHELRRRDAAVDAREAAREAAVHRGVLDVRPYRGVPLDVSAARSGGRPADVDRQGDSERGGDGRAAGWDAVRPGRARRARAPGRPRESRLLERPGENRDS